MRLGVGIVACVVAVSAGTARAGHGGAIIPPLEIELGHAVTGAPDGGRVESMQLLVGVSWASLYPKPTPVDFSVGVISTFAPQPDQMAAARAVGPDAAGASATGGYIDVAVRGAAGRHWRTWIGGRGEVMDHGQISALGAAARASIEVWTGTAIGDRDCAILGTVALSAWAESGIREQPHGGSATFVAAGLGMRVPLIIAAR